MYRLAYIFWHILALISISCRSSENTLSHIYCCSPSGCPSSNSMMKNSDRWLMKWKWGNKAITVQSVCICPSRTDDLADFILWKIHIYISCSFFFSIMPLSKWYQQVCNGFSRGQKAGGGQVFWNGCNISWNNTRLFFSLSVFVGTRLVLFSAELFVQPNKSCYWSEIQLMTGANLRNFRNWVNNELSEN